MNDEHVDDNLIIAQAFGPEQARTALDAQMIALDEEGGEWSWATDLEEGTARVDWPSGRISDRAEIRRELVLLYRAGCARLGIEPRAE